VVLRESWLAHALFGSTPAEVWSTCFAANGKIVLSGGDDVKVKCWDVRASKLKPVHTFANHFDAGVTVLSPHPRNEHLVAIGSYDETLGIYDIRYDCQKRLRKSACMGGGIWRIQWHPNNDNRFLLAAMHGGCRVVNLVDEIAGTGGDTMPPSIETEMEFTKHQSMAYGVDWLVGSEPGDESYVEAAASCSFYDRATYLWRIR
jgi:diphthamide biosynthesis protein 7